MLFNWKYWPFLSPTFPWLLFFRLIQAFGASVGSVITQSMMRESFNDLQRGKFLLKQALPYRYLLPSDP